MSQPAPQEVPQPPLATYSLSTILTRAASHHIYKPLLLTTSASLNLDSFSYLHKDHLIQSFAELRASNPNFLHSTYISPTGGTRSNATNHLYFFTSSAENRNQRSLASTLISTLKVFTPEDIVINLHGGVPMYRCQDLAGTIIDYCGATDLSIGSDAKDADVAQIGRTFGANTIAAPSSRLLQFARYVYGLRKEMGEEKVGLRLKKALFTSEPLSRAQEMFLKEALGVEVMVSMYGSAEAGPWCGAVPQKIVEGHDVESVEVPGAPATRSFVFDRRQMVVEIVDPEGKVLNSSTNPHPEAKQPSVGEIVLTSLTRFTNPLVRYRTGDFGSLHPLHSIPGTGEILKDSPQCSDYLYGITMHGRDTSNSFFLDSDYVNTVELDRRVFSNPEWEIVEWQVIIYHLTDEELRDAGEGFRGEGVEFRVVRKCDKEVPEGYEERLRERLVQEVISEEICIRIRVVGYEELEKGRMARKVLKIVDRRM